MLERHQEDERRKDWRAYFAGIAPRLEKPPKPSEAFVSLAEMGDGGSGFRREDLPAEWKVHMGSDLEVVNRIHAAMAAANLRRMSTNKAVQ